jgi:hypothetical protein
MENAILKIINNFSISKTKTKWEVVGKLSELYLKTGNQLRLEMYVNLLKVGYKVDVTHSLDPIEKYRTEILDLIKIVANSS